MKEKLRFAALIRVSTPGQEEKGESLTTQKKSNEADVASLGGRIVGWYGGQEHGTPGYEKKEIQRLLSDAAKGRFDAVIVHEPFRWSRDNEQSKAGIRLFNEFGIRFFVATKEYDLFNPTDILALGIFAELGEFVARSTNKQSIATKTERADNNVPTAGRLPFGRVFKRSKDRKSGTWELVPDKAAKIRDCAKRYLQGESLKDLAVEHEMKPWNLWKILTKRSGDEWTIHFPKARHLKEKNRTKKLKVPRLLDEDTIKAIRAKAQANRTYTHGHIKNRYLLSRMIFCAHCGYAMPGQTNHDKTRYHRHKTRERVCPGPKKWVPADQVEKAVIEQLFEMFGNPIAVQQAIERETPNAAKVKEQRERRDFLAHEIIRLEASRQRVLDLVVKDTIDQNSADLQLKKMKHREAKLKEELNRLDDELAHLPSKEQVVKGAKSIYGSMTAYIAKHRYNRNLKRMSWAQRRKLCEMVFGGKTDEGKRMGVYVRWDDSGKKWRYRIHGILIDDKGPIPSRYLEFSELPPGQNALVTKCASRLRGTGPLALRSCGRALQRCR